MQSFNEDTSHEATTRTSPIYDALEGALRWHNTAPILGDGDPAPADLL